MSSITITVPKEYGQIRYCYYGRDILRKSTSTSTVVLRTTDGQQLGVWHGARARPYRLATKIRHPKNFAEESDIAAAPDAATKKAMHLWNCAQRAHAHYLETQPSTALAILLAGLRYPLASTYLGVAWMVSRVMFAIGYTAKDKENGSGRMAWFALQMPLQLSIWGLAVWTGYKMAS